MVYFIISINIENKKNRKDYDDYIAKVKPIIEKYGGRYVIRSENVTAVSDKWNPDRVIIIEWRNKEQLFKCLNSEEYAAIKHKRENNVESRAVLAEDYYENTSDKNWF